MPISIIERVREYKEVKLSNYISIRHTIYMELQL